MIKKILSLALLIIVFCAPYQSKSQVISTFAGTGAAAFGGDATSATAAQLNNPFGVAVDAAGNVYIADTYNNRIRKVSIGTGIISTIAGTGSATYGGDNGPATSAFLQNPRGI